ncbi:cytochrome P450 [Parafrankia elaeagni]|uniref:cytochrome P450 n=1 Tax=Parafrankia elaeagni TaxID=222534 RepID=UPI0003829515|nr:cytochrome P450 [Parafrankia elaeagni]
MSATISSVFDELSREVGSTLIGDPYPLFAERRRETPVMEGDIMGEFGLPAMAASADGSRPMYTLFRYEDVTAALRDAATFSSRVIMEVMEPLFGRVVLGMDGEEHRLHRGLYAPAFTRRLVESWRQEVMRPVARQMVRGIAATPDKRTNLVDLALAFPVKMIYQVIGLPEDQEAYDAFAYRALVQQLASMGINRSNPEETMNARRRGLEASNVTYEQLLGVVKERRALGSDGDDLMSRMIRSDFEGQRMTDEQIAGFIRVLLTPASETTTRSFLNVTTLLLQRPEVLDQLRQDRSLILPAIDEGMRIEPVAVVIGRITTRQVEVRGVTIPAHAGITLCTGSANRDEDVFEDPEAFNLHRKFRTGLGFGLGPHLCPGMNAARAEMHETIDALLDEMPNLRLDPDQPAPEIRGMMLRSPAAVHVVWD